VEPHIELIVFGLLVAVSGLAVVARLVSIPYPILLVLGGLAFGFVPGVPDLQLEPDLVLLLFLPPLLYAAAFFANLRELRANARPIGMLAIGLVIATMLTVAGVAHEVVGLSWPVAFVLGAVVSPTDAVAPAEILRRLSVPRRVVSVVEGENLTNDWTALAAYKFAVAAVVTGSFSLLEAGPEFRVHGPRRSGRGSGGRGGDRGRAQARGGSDHRDHDLAAHRLRGLPSGRADRRFRSARRGQRRGVAGLAGVGAHKPHHPPAAHRDLAAAGVSAQCRALRAGGPPASYRARSAVGTYRRRARRVRRPHRRRGDRGEDRVGLRAHLSHPATQQQGA